MTTHYPQREGEPECRDFLRTGRCKYGESCKYHHPIGGLTLPSNPTEPLFPIRPNEPPCQYFLKHGTCKFGQTCIFDHPANLLPARVGSSMPGEMFRNSQHSVITWCNTTHSGSSLHCHDTQSLLRIHPQRPGEPNCVYFLRNGKCKFGATCRYHHPTIGEFSFPPCSAQLNEPFRGHYVKGGRTRSMSVGSMYDKSSVCVYLTQDQYRRLQAQDYRTDNVALNSDGSKLTPSLESYSLYNSLPSDHNSFDLSYTEGSKKQNAQLPDSVESSNRETGFFMEPEIDGSFVYNSQRSRGRSLSNNDLWQVAYCPLHTSIHNKREKNKTTESYILSNVSNDSVSCSPAPAGLQSLPTTTKTLSGFSRDDSSNDIVDTSISLSSTVRCESHFQYSPREDTTESLVSDHSSSLSARNHTVDSARRKSDYRIDDGLSMMTSALLSMLDTQEENRPLNSFPPRRSQHEQHINSMLPKNKLTRRQEILDNIPDSDLSADSPLFKPSAPIMQKVDQMFLSESGHPEHPSRQWLCNRSTSITSTVRLFENNSHIFAATIKAPAASSFIFHEAD